MIFNFLKFTLVILVLTLSICNAQYTIKGKVTDASSGEALPYVVIQIKGTDVGAQTDFDGNYILKTTKLPDSLQATYVGYRTKTRAVDKSQNVQTINFQIIEDTKLIGEVVVKRGENPAWEILRRVQRNKGQNDKRNLKSYEYDSYAKVQVDVDNISKKLRNNKLLKPVIAAIDSMKKVTDDEGRPVIPIYISETLSKIYYNNNPYHFKEYINANKVTGVMDESNAVFISQMTGSGSTDFNFYKNWIRFLGRDFVSPIAESWKDYYDYDLEDSMYVDSKWAYKINVKPNREADLAFKGTIWIAKDDYALVRLDLTMGKGANINFIEKLKIQEELEKTKTGPYVPSKIRFTIDMSEMADSSAGFLIKYYISNRNIIENQPKEDDFFRVSVERSESASQYDDKFWYESRHDSLSEMDKRVFAMVDTIKRLPVVKSYIELVDIAINGHKKFGFIELGPYIETIAFNNIEGLRLRLGFRTNLKFHKRLMLKGYAAYGTKDERLKYSIGADYWFSKRKWFLIGGEYKYDIEQLAIFTNYRAPGSQFFYAFSRWGNINSTNPFYVRSGSLYTAMDVFKGISQKISFNYQYFDPVPKFDPYYNFAYIASSGDTSGSLRNAELVFETRIARKESFLYFEHRRLSLGNENIPIITFRYHLGLKGVMKSEFNYHKFSLNAFHKITIGKLGQTVYSLTANYVPTVLPFPLLNIHLGNQSMIYNPGGFNMMDFFEFVSDKSVSINARHYFNGLLLNRIPLINKTKVREMISFNAVWGTVSNKNISLIPVKYTDSGQQVYRIFNSLDQNLPYCEVGAGFENIFKVFNIQAYRRLTYLNQDNEMRNWGIKIGATLSL